MVLNRWGELVWETLDYQTPWLGEKGDDGQHFCPNGLYIWEAVWVDQIGYNTQKSTDDILSAIKEWTNHSDKII